MNGGSYRTPSSGGRVINRDGGGNSGSSSSSSASAQSYRQPDESQAYVPREEPSRSSSYQSSRASSDNSGGKKARSGLLWTIVIALLIGIFAVLTFFGYGAVKSEPTGIDNSRYQAVFLTNGQIYFGKLESHSNDTFKITKVYYPEVKSESASDEGEAASDNSAAAQSSIKLMRVTEGVHGPDDEMFITKSQILYYENLKADSQVAKLIEQNR